MGRSTTPWTVRTPALPVEESLSPRFSSRAGAVATTIVEEKATVRYLVPLDDSLGETWRTAAFDDAGWTSAVTGLGFETNGGTLEEKITTNISTEMRGVNSTAYLRLEFNIENEIANINELILKMQYDDGFVAWINGVQVASANAELPVSWNSEASSGHTDSKAIVFEDFTSKTFRIFW